MFSISPLPGRVLFEANPLTDCVVPTRSQLRFYLQLYLVFTTMKDTLVRSFTELMFILFHRCLVLDISNRQHDKPVRGQVLGQISSEKALVGQAMDKNDQRIRGSTRIGCSVLFGAHHNITGVRLMAYNRLDATGIHCRVPHLNGGRMNICFGIKLLHPDPILAVFGIFGRIRTQTNRARTSIRLGGSTILVNMALTKRMKNALNVRMFKILSPRC